MQSEQTNPDKHLFFERIRLESGWARDTRIAIRDGRISAIIPGAQPERTDEIHSCAIAGMPNLHSHAFQRGMAGLAERRGPSNDSFWTWRDIMYRFLDRMTPDDMQAIAALAYVEMLESGFTRVGEFHYLHHDRGGAFFADKAEMVHAIGAAAAQSGIGLTLLPVLYSYAGFGAQPARPEQARFVMGVDDYVGLLESAERAVAFLPDALVGIAPHSLRAVTPDQLQTLAALRPERPIHIHIAEQVREVEDCLAWSGQRPVEWLLDHVDINDRWCLVHATHLMPEETANLARSRAIAGLCPITEANLGDGLFPALPFVEAGGRYGIGSDSNVLIDASEELRLLEYGQRLLHRGRNILACGAGRSTGSDLHAAALDGGSAALGTAAGMVVGASADIVSLDPGHPSLAGREDSALMDGFLFAAGRSAIDCVWRHGEKLVSEGKHRARGPVVQRYLSALEKITA